ncbi:MAG: class I SAM-dependent methyltransferase [Mariniphaga sp.]|nr:class I SAM-dependent methyltransferase [Mariniphaga sp.]
MQNTHNYYKQIEFNRFNNSSKRTIENFKIQKCKLTEIDSIPLFLQEPYHYFYSALNSNKQIGNKILDLCSGDGIHSVKFAKMGFDVLCTDIVPNSLEIAKIRAVKMGVSNIDFQVADAENLNFQPYSFDMVTIIGSLSYLDLNLFIKQVKQVLRPGGKLLILDSFNHNPIYKINRFIHYLKGKRTISTLKRMPTKNTLKILSQNFKHIETFYFGIFAFLGTLISIVYGSKTAVKIISQLDARFTFLKKYAFKIVIEITN